MENETPKSVPQSLAKTLLDTSSTRTRSEYHATAHGYVVEVIQTSMRDAGAVDWQESDAQVSVKTPKGTVVATMAPTLDDAFAWAADMIDADRAS